MGRNHYAIYVVFIIIALSVGVAIKVKIYGLCRAEGLSATYCLWR